MEVQRGRVTCPDIFYWTHIGLALPKARPDYTAWKTLSHPVPFINHAGAVQTAVFPALRSGLHFRKGLGDHDQGLKTKNGTKEKRGDKERDNKERVKRPLILVLANTTCAFPCI